MWIHELLYIGIIVVLTLPYYKFFFSEEEHLFGKSLKALKQIFDFIK